jgi:hypothetical protein
MKTKKVKAPRFALGKNSLTTIEDGLTLDAIRERLAHKDCPFCGSERVNKIEGALKCLECGAIGPTMEYGNQEYFVRMWNNRETFDNMPDFDGHATDCAVFVDAVSELLAEIQDAVKAGDLDALRNMNIEMPDNEIVAGASGIARDMEKLQ